MAPVDTFSYRVWPRSKPANRQAKEVRSMAASNLAFCCTYVRSYNPEWEPNHSLKYFNLCHIMSRVANVITIVHALNTMSLNVYVFVKETTWLNYRVKEKKKYR